MSDFDYFTIRISIILPMYKKMLAKAHAEMYYIFVLNNYSQNLSLTNSSLKQSHNSTPRTPWQLLFTFLYNL